MIFFAELCEAKGIQQFFIMLWPDSLYTILKLNPYRKIFPTICNMPGPVLIKFFTKKCREAVRRHRLNLNAGHADLSGLSDCPSTRKRRGSFQFALKCLYFIFTSHYTTVTWSCTLLAGTRNYFCLNSINVWHTML